jgi:hypothetical protein
MRCFFLRNGHVAAVEMLSGLSDEAAIAKAHLLFSERGQHFDAFEVWRIFNSDGPLWVVSH